MGPKVIAILLLVVGLGIGLFLFNSGLVGKLSSTISSISGSSTSTVATTTNTISGSATTTTAHAQATSSPNSFIAFLNRIFHPTTATGPVGVGSTGGGTSGIETPGGGHESVGQSPTPSPTPSTPISTSTIPANQIPKGFTLAQLSPYFHMIRFSGVGTSQIGISAPGTTQSTTTIDITGWDIKSNRGGVFIPQAVNIYNPSADAILSDIVLTTRAGDIVYLYSGSSAKGPVNLRLNECMGFLNVTHQFNPALPSSCPPVDRTAITNFTGQCQNYILSLGCQPVNMNSTQIPRTDYACQQYLEDNFTYNSCVSTHAIDKNFLSNQWHVWIGTTPLDSYHDNVELLDRQGLLVDLYTY